MNILGCSDYELTVNKERLEEFIVLRSILDKNLPKLVASDQSIFLNILGDIFPKTQMPNPDMTQVHQVARMLLQKEMLYSGDTFLQNVINLHNAVASAHGILVVGEAMAGKSKSLKVLIDTLNKLHDSEYEAMARTFTLQKAEKLGIAIKEEDGVIMPKYLDVRNETLLKLKEEEVKLIKRRCTYNGIDNRIVNPKAISIKHLMGHFDETSREWTDGLLTYYFRQACADKSGRMQLLTFDGSIEPDWVENLNSVLDDNKRLTLSTGESLYLQQKMAIVLETALLAATSPATISRCAIVYVRLESLAPKAQFNTWLNDLPPILKD
jgi:dynein heavy chain, axonemal